MREVANISKADSRKESKADTRKEANIGTAKKTVPRRFVT
jgi:hypothetical protein